VGEPSGDLPRLQDGIGRVDLEHYAEELVEAPLERVEAALDVVHVRLAHPIPGDDVEIHVGAMLDAHVVVGREEPPQAEHEQLLPYPRFEGGKEKELDPADDDEAIELGARLEVIFGYGPGIERWKSMLRIERLRSMNTPTMKRSSSLWAAPAEASSSRRLWAAAIDIVAGTVARSGAVLPMSTPWAILACLSGSVKNNPIRVEGFRVRGQKMKTEFNEYCWASRDREPTELKEKISLYIATFIMLITGILTNGPAVILESSWTGWLARSHTIRHSSSLYRSSQRGHLAAGRIDRVKEVPDREYRHPNRQDQTVRVIERLLKVDIGGFLYRQQIGSLYGASSDPSKGSRYS